MFACYCVHTGGDAWESVSCTISTTATRWPGQPTATAALVSYPTTPTAHRTGVLLGQWAATTANRERDLTGPSHHMGTPHAYTASPHQKTHRALSIRDL